MWHHIVLLAVFLCILSAGVKPLDVFEGPLWRNRISDTLISQDEVSSENSELYRNQNPYEDAESNFPLYSRPSVGKRALAMFARWGSINSIGKNRPPIRSNSYESDDSFNINNRRMQGQPLRWG